MAPLESTTRQVGAGVSGTLKSCETRRMLLPFSMLWETVPVFALGPWNIDEVCISILAAGAIASAASVKTDNMRWIRFILVLLVFVLRLLLYELDGVAVGLADNDCFAVRQRG